MRFSRLLMVGTVSLFMLTWLVGLSATTAQGQEVSWEQIIGIIQAGNLVGSTTGAPGTGGQVTGGGQPWSTTRGEATVDLATGEIKFEVQGLVLAGGAGGAVVIGTPGPVTQVKGTLVCDTNGSAGGGNSTLVDTPLVPLSPQGDAEFSGNVGSLPSACVNEPDIAFLVRASAGRWIANGAVRIP